MARTKHKQRSVKELREAVRDAVRAAKSRAKVVEAKLAAASAPPVGKLKVDPGAAPAAADASAASSLPAALEEPARLAAAESGSSEPPPPLAIVAVSDSTAPGTPADVAVRRETSVSDVPEAVKALQPQPVPDTLTAPGSTPSEPLPIALPATPVEVVGPASSDPASSLPLFPAEGVSAAAEAEAKASAPDTVADEAGEAAGVAPAAPSPVTSPAPSLCDVAAGYRLPPVPALLVPRAPLTLEACLASFSAPEKLRVAAGNGFVCSRCSCAGGPAPSAAPSQPEGAPDASADAAADSEASVGGAESVAAPAQAMPAADDVAPVGAAGAAPVVDSPAAGGAEEDVEAPEEGADRKEGDCSGVAAARLSPSAEAGGSDDAESDDGDAMAVPLAALAAAKSASAAAPARANPGITLRDATKRILPLADALPPALTLHLKRFAVVPAGGGGKGGGGLRLVKLSARVAFPEVLDLAPFVAQRLDAGGGEGVREEEPRRQPRAAPPPPPPPPILYRLAGVVVHGGGLSGGHYVAYVRHGELRPYTHPETGEPLEPPCGAAWAHCSDSHVTPSSAGAALASEAYLLFYERVTAAAEGPGAAAAAAQ